MFNFYEPDYRPAGPIAEAGLYAPEFQIIDENYVIRTANHLYTRVWSGYVGMPGAPADRPLLDLAPVAALAHDPQAMVDLLDLRLTYGSMSPGLRDILRRMIAELPGDGLTKARAAIQIVTLSPDFAVQR
ncbi:MAG: hypothetical protein RML12_07375 [Xanthomonadales bacterium]|nr:hypothetical protein [Xanthomonadales bacterium]